MKMPRLMVGLGLALAVFGLVPSVAAASNWVSTGRGGSAKTGEGKSVSSIQEIDLASIARTGKYVKAWVRETFPGDVIAEPGGKTYRMRVQFYYYDCSGRMYDLYSVSEYSESGDVVDSMSLSSEAELTMTPLPPDSVGAYALDYVCKAVKAKG